MNRYKQLIKNELCPYTIHDWLEGRVLEYRSDGSSYIVFVHVGASCFIDGRLWLKIKFEDNNEGDFGEWKWQYDSFFTWEMVGEPLHRVIGGKIPIVGVS